jgi:predicted amidophosphoribosyltransferase
VHAILHSTAFNFTKDMLVVLVVVFWLGIASWVYRDARRRVDDPWLVALAAIVALGIPFIGALVYMLFRAPETLDDVRARDVELLALQARIERREDRCPVCRTRVDASFLVCPMCTSRLKQECASCSAPLEPLWQMCPYCTASVHPALAPVADDLDAALTAEAAVVSAVPHRRKTRDAAA